jgi:hypothetical protein
MYVFDIVLIKVLSGASMIVLKREFVRIRDELKKGLN